MPTFQPQCLSASDTIAICAVIVALLALFATFRQTSLAREHNRISVTPHLDFLTTRVKGGPTGIELINNGLGPAIVGKVTVSFDDSPFEVGRDGLPPICLQQLEALPFAHRWLSLTPGTPIGIGKSMNMLTLFPDPNNKQQCEQAVTMVNRFNYSVKYRSMYGEEFEAKT